MRRIFDWFNAFRLMKFTHYVRDNFYPNQEVLQETNLVFKKIGLEECNSKVEALIKLRDLQNQSYTWTKT